MGTPYCAKAVANFFVTKSLGENIPVTPMKLLKLVYIAHGWHLAILNEPLIEDRVEAWIYGPVIPEIYHEFKHFGTLAIDKFATEYEPIFVEGRLRSAKLVAPEIDSDDKESKVFLNRVWEVYKEFSGIQLSNMTHEAGSPWHSVFYDNPRSKSVIGDKAIKEHYLKRLKTQ